MIYLDGAMSLTVEAGDRGSWSPVWEWKNFSLGARSKGTRHPPANIASFTRLHPNIMMTKAKVGGKLCELDSGQDRVATRRIRRGDHAWSRWICGRVHRRKSLPRSKIRSLPTRGRGFSKHYPRQPITLARDLGYSVVEESISRDQLYIANEVCCVRHGGGSSLVCAEIDFSCHRRWQGWSRNPRLATGVR